MNEQQIRETMTSLIKGNFYRNYDDVAVILDVYLAYERISKETYDNLLRMAKESYPSTNDDIGM